MYKTFSLVCYAVTLSQCNGIYLEIYPADLVDLVFETSALIHIHSCTCVHVCGLPDKLGCMACACMYVYTVKSDLLLLTCVETGIYRSFAQSSFLLSSMVMKCGVITESIRLWVAASSTDASRASMSSMHVPLAGDPWQTKDQMANWLKNASGTPRKSWIMLLRIGNTGNLCWNCCPRDAILDKRLKKYVCMYGRAGLRPAHDQCNKLLSNSNSLSLSLSGRVLSRKAV